MKQLLNRLHRLVSYEARVLGHLSDFEAEAERLGKAMTLYSELLGNLGRLPQSEKTEQIRRAIEALRTLTVERVVRMMEMSAQLSMALQVHRATRQTPKINEAAIREVEAIFNRQMASLTKEIA